MTMKRKTFTTETKAIDAEAGIFEAMITTESVDRDGDILKAEGARLESYFKNPVVLFGHNYGDIDAVVGKALEVEVLPGKGIRSRFQFADAETSPTADRVRRLWAGGFLNATSVGFIPKEHERRTDEDGKAVGGFLFNEWELLEFSIVPVPANQEALRLAFKMLDADEDVNTDFAYLQIESKAETKEDNAGLGDEPETAINTDTDAGEETPNNTTPSHDASEELPEDVIDQLAQTIEELMEVLQ